MTEPPQPKKPGEHLPLVARADERLVRELPLTVLRSLATPLRDLELRHAGRTLVLSLGVGTAVGLVACVFLLGLHLTERIFLHQIAGYTPLLSEGERAILATPLPHQSFVPWLLVAVPALGGLVTGVLGHYLAPEVLGGGGNAYVEAFHGGGFLRRRVLLLKLAASVSTLGTGGSGGREGPTMLIGAAVGNLISRLLRLSQRDGRLLLVAGTAGGLAAIFGTPLGAGLLATEVLYRDDFESDALAPAILSSVTAYSVLRLVFPLETHMFAVAERYPFEPHRLWAFVLLSLLISLGGHFFLVQLRLVRALFDSSPFPRWLRPCLGGLGVGLLALAWISTVNPSLGLVQHGIGILGSGYGIAQAAILAPGWMPKGGHAVILLGALAVVKMFATALTLESGGSAGDFGPSITIGGLLGGAFGYALQLVVPGVPEPGAFALVGMATFYGGIAHTPVAAVVMVCEMAGSYDLLVPLMLSVGLSYLALRRVRLYPAQHESRAAAASEATLLDTVWARDLAGEQRPPITVSESASPAEVHAAVAKSEDAAVVVTDAAGRARGVIEGRTLSDGSLDPALSLVVVAADLATPVQGVREADPLSSVLASMMESNAHVVPVVDNHGRALWLLTEHDVTRAYYGVLAVRRKTPRGDHSPPA